MSTADTPRTPSRVRPHIGARPEGAVAHRCARATRVMRHACPAWLVAFGVSPASAPPDVRVNARLRRALGRCVLATGRIDIRPDVASGPLSKLREVLCHELAHLAVHRLHGDSARPHGPEWRGLMAAAGFSPVAAARTCTVRRPMSTRTHTNGQARFEHRCPVCQMVRSARRPVRAWRCADCVAAGLTGALMVTRVDPRP